ncbi:MAG: hypothetical protein KGI67_09125 [Pseudomonadota bacterium]|nr:hypothetical protein [Pseudomonadota bacterium]
MPKLATSWQKFAVIEQLTGYMWWIGDARDPIDACKNADLHSPMAAPVEAREFEQIDGSRIGSQSAYAVYSVPAGLLVTDGADDVQIDAVTSPALVGYFRAIDR